MEGALAAAWLSAIVIGLVSLYARQREDTGTTCRSVGMAIVGPDKAKSYNAAMGFGDIFLVGCPQPSAATISGNGAR